MDLINVAAPALSGAASYEQCEPGRCGICSNQHVLVWQETRIANYYDDADQILKENGYPVW